MSDDPAKARFFIIQSLRLSGAGLVVLAMLILSGKIDFPEIAGYALLLAGLVDVFFLPVLLARKWKSPDR